MRKKSGFNFAENTYYFTIKSSPNNITIYRKDKREAVNIFIKYQEMGKDCQWHGKWDGKNWAESDVPSAIL